MRKILCVCSANTARSPMMQEVLARLLGKEFQVESAGTYDGLRDLPIGGGSPPNETIQEFARKKGFDISASRTRHVSQLNLSEYELIICVDVLIREEVRDWLQTPTPIIVANESEGGIHDPSRHPGPLDEPSREKSFQQILRSMREVAQTLL